MIRINKLNKYFNKGKQNEIHVINDVSLELPDKGMVAIFGKSGCGKTTLLNVIGGLDWFASGSVMVDSGSIENDPDLMRNKYMGYVFQNYNLDVSKSCFDNIADALKLCGVYDHGVIERRVMAALKNVGMEKFAKRSPDTLSGGQQQRIAIARAIVKNPNIILADEPTGNLDEVNTVMIMDLLKAISRDHLVILVTHEAELVDYYCDTVIELADGKVVNIKKNELADGFAAKDKNTLYLGEFEKKIQDNENVCLEYYGDAPSEPLKLKIVNDGGKIYVRFDSDKVQILDQSAEVKLIEGVYDEKKQAKESVENINMNDLPPISGTKFGRLFNLKSSIISGYRFNFKQLKKKKKVLRNCLAMLAAVLVFMMSLFGTSIGQIIDARSMYNRNVFYVYTPDGSVSSKLTDALSDNSAGIDCVRLTGLHTGDENVQFITGFFETFQSSFYDEGFTASAVYLDSDLAKDMTLAEGKNKDLESYEIVITTAVADKLLENSPLGYIEEYRDLIGLVSTYFSVDGKNARIAGVVKSSETSIYVDSLALAKYVMQYIDLFVVCEDEVDIEVEPGETVLLVNNTVDSSVKYPSAGSKVMLHGVQVDLKDVHRGGMDYQTWVKNELGVAKSSSGEFFRSIMSREFPNLSAGSEAYNIKLAEISEERYCEWLEYYYSERDGYYEYLYLFDSGSLDLWLATAKGEELGALYTYLSNELAVANKYRQLYGKYPTFTELTQSVKKFDELIWNDITSLYGRYEQEFYKTYSKYFDWAYVLDREDYIAVSKQLGETDDSASYGDIIYTSDVYYEDEYYGNVYYTVVHSTDVKKTQAWLEENFADLTVPNPEFMEAILTPEEVFDSLIARQLEGVISNIISMAVITVLLVLCMYFIMRSSLMSRIKEVGINRAIGVSKKNLVFKFFIEAAVLTTLTVFVGYLLTSAFITACLAISPMVSALFFYPWWYALLLLAFLYFVSSVCGILPILGLLRKTPSEILAKYDI